MQLFGLTKIRVRRSSWRGTHNIEVVGVLPGVPPVFEKQREAAERYLSQFLVDRSEGETRLLRAWLDQFDEQAVRCWAYPNQT